VKNSRLSAFAMLLLVGVLNLSTGLTRSAHAAELIDGTPRVAVMSAFEPEWQALQALLQDRSDHAVNGTVFATGTISGKPVVVFLSGIGPINAAMATQLVFERFRVDAIVISGIGGGVNPELSIGDVVVPQQWSSLQVVLARKVGNDYVVPEIFDRAVPNLGMIFPQPTQISQIGQKPEKRLWFEVDSHLLDIAKTVANGAALKDCSSDHNCLAHHPKVIVGGRGVSGPAFVDNSGFRDYIRRAFNADTLDMESAAVAHVAYANHVPFIAFRSLSDLAGADPDRNQMQTFGALASGNSASVLQAFLAALH
jgi:adenosylhomocysteine nucleosidase